MEDGLLFVPPWRDKEIFIFNAMYHMTANMVQEGDILPDHIHSASIAAAVWWVVFVFMSRIMTVKDITDIMDHHDNENKD